MENACLTEEVIYYLVLATCGTEEYVSVLIEPDRLKPAGSKWPAHELLEMLRMASKAVLSIDCTGTVCLQARVYRNGPNYTDYTVRRFATTASLAIGPG